MGDNKGAMQDLNKAICMHPDIYYLYNRVLVEMRSNNHKDALRDCNLAIALDKSNPFTYYQRVMYYIVTGDTKKL